MCLFETRCTPRAPMFSEVKAGTIFENIKQGNAIFWVQKCISAFVEISVEFGLTNII